MSAPVASFRPPRLLLAGLLALALAPAAPSAFGQAAGTLDQPPSSGRWERDWDKVLWARQDYFAKDQNPRIAKLVTTVEQYHFDKKVWASWQRGDYREVAGEMKYVLGVLPNHPRALALLCSIARITQSYSLPIPFFEKALSLFPQHALTHAQYGNYLVAIGRVSAGILRLEEAMLIDPSLPQARAGLEQARAVADSSGVAQAPLAPGKLIRYSGPLPPDRPSDFSLEGVEP